MKLKNDTKPSCETYTVIILSYKDVGALVKRLSEETRNQKVVSSFPRARYWMDIFHIYLL